MAELKKNLFIEGVECITPSKYLNQRKIQAEKRRKEIKDNLKKPEYFSERFPYKKLSLKEKQSEENEDIALQRLKTDVHRGYTGTFQWVLFKVNRELIFKKSEPLFFSTYSHIYLSEDLPQLLKLCWEMEVYGHCIFYRYKRYDVNILKDLIHHFTYAKIHIDKARNIILNKENEDIHKKKKNTPQQISTLGRSVNVPANFSKNLLFELEIMQYELLELRKIAEEDIKLPEPDPDRDAIWLQYFIYLGTEIFKHIDWSYFPKFNHNNNYNYDSECRNFIIKLASLLPEIEQTMPSTIKNAFYRKKDFNMEFLDLISCESQQHFEELLSKIDLKNP